jgi:hypothetical protein
MQNFSPDEFLAELEEFLARSGMSASAFGKEVLKDPNFVSDLRAGRSPSLIVAKQVATFINGYAG